MVREIRIYIEGVGDRDETETQLPSRTGFNSKIRSGKETTAGLRPGFRTFFKSLYELADRQGIDIRLILCGSRDDAYEDFKLALESHPDAFNILLVDSEDPVAPGDTPWKHLRRREKKRWQWDADAVLDDAQCHLMVQTMEAWFMADVDALKMFYGKGFREDDIRWEMSKQKINNNVENLTKGNLERLLKAATRDSAQGKYHKSRHAPEILKLLDVHQVREGAGFCDRLFVTVINLLTE